MKDSVYIVLLCLGSLFTLFMTSGWERRHGTGWTTWSWWHEGRSFQHTITVQMFIVKKLRILPNILFINQFLKKCPIRFLPILLIKVSVKQLATYCMLMLSVTYANSDNCYEILSTFQSLYQPLSCLLPTYIYSRIIGIIKLIEMLLNHDVAKKGMLLCGDVTVPEFGVQLKQITKTSVAL